MRKIVAVIPPTVCNHNGILLGITPLVFLSLISAVTSVNHIWVTIPLGSKLSAQENGYWVSENGTFAMGFFSQDENESYSVGIWYNSIPRRVQAAVWTAGEDVTVSQNSSFELSAEGNLILYDFLTGSPAWTSNTSNVGIVGASLLDNGNLILSDNAHKIVWESFHTPTDTLLPGQRLQMCQSLRAASRNSIASYYSLAMEESGNLVLRWENNVTYWTSGTGSFSSKSSATGAIFAGNGVLGLFNKKGMIIWSKYSEDFTDPFVVLRYLRLDVDGNLRMYSWIEELQIWRAGWQAVENQCDVFACCGLYGVCSFNSTKPICKCPFEGGPNTMGTESEIEWEMGSGRSCRKLMNLGPCNEGNSMVVLKQTILYGLYPPKDVHNYASSEECKETCLKDSSCVAATAMNDGTGACTIKRTSFIGGYHYGSVPAISFLKVCLSPEAVANFHNYPRKPNSINPFQNSSFSPSSSTAHVLCGSCIVAASVSTLCIVLVIQIGAGWYAFRRGGIRGKQWIPLAKHELMDPHSKTLIQLSFGDVEELTKEFRHRLGPTVFKGTLPNKKPVIIKQLDDEIAEREFRMTLSILGSTRHRNLVSLHGFCCDAQHRLLVYEYVNNGSLDRWLSGSMNQGKGLNWQRRLNIATGIARAIAYLHMECRECIAHSNLKLENVMLDDQFVAKVTDFGLSKLSRRISNQSTSSSESCPERDVFSFGVMLLEIISGKRDPPSSDRPVEHRICKWAFQKYQTGHLDRIVDSRMERNLDWDQVERALRIAFWCIQEQSFLRPSMSEVVKVLEGTFQVDKPPIPQAILREAHAGACRKLKEVATEEEDVKGRVEVSAKRHCLQLATISCSTHEGASL